MKLFNTSDLAKALDISQAAISVYTKRGKITVSIVGGKKMIDIDLPENKNFLDSYCRKNNKTFDVTRIYSTPPKPKPSKEKPKTVIDVEVLEKGATKPPKKTKKQEKQKQQQESLVYREQKLKVKKLENENKYKELQIEKMQGRLIPTEVAQHLSLYAIDVFLKTFTQNVRSLTNIYAQRLGASPAQFVDLQKKLLIQIQNIAQESKDSILSGIKGAVKDYSEVRSRGEKK